MRFTPIAPVAVLLFGCAFGAPAGQATAQPAVEAATASLPASAPKSITIDVFDGLELTQGAITAAGLTAILTDILIEDPRFSVIEGGAGGARFLMRGVVIRYDPGAGGMGVQVGGFSGFGRMLGAGARTHTTTVGIVLRLIDASSGQVVATARASGSATGQDADAGVMNSNNGSTVGATAFRGTPVAKAFEDAMRKAATDIAVKAAALP